MIARTILAVVLTAAAMSVTAVVAQTDFAAARKELMKNNGQHAYGVLNRTARGQNPYDQAKVDAAFAALAESAPKIPTLFPPGSYQGPVAGDEYYTASKAFENKADIEARVAKYIKDLADNRGTPKDLDSLKTVWPALLQRNCDSCHDAYRVKKG
jgi:cytochrome c556